MFCLGVKELGNIVEVQSIRILEFVEAQQLLGIPPNWFIWQQLQNIILTLGSLPLEIEVQLWVDWHLQGQITFL